ncbi:BZ3500_MvSof-1268-A1-R1_Chr12-2g03940 [Microbotryum saponariae]|uniref:BZ3500_MvSof-1268-A1-R1_Chr12-2g03940 protein n=1 Tax=Microbotryum saponariae TaxID=289078 RepID=A0A2X0KZT0_9BASI|nr:BZ3500_MvSof-1268-A1-R1_Chr12-2g03940 [Microbotryum saponariae]SCZ99744.1 BZ3501_MvSof-1269-A2-R1_Chr12-2g03446 [Microbotryum saponariae]
MLYKTTRPLAAPPDAKSIQTTSVPAAEFPNWLARQRATINWPRHKSKSYKSKACIAVAPNQPSSRSGTRLKGQHRRMMLEQHICSWAVTCHALATTNYIESWHKILKFRYIGREQRQQTDQLIHNLTMTAEPTYR